MKASLKVSHPFLSLESQQVSKNDSDKILLREKLGKENIFPSFYDWLLIINHFLTHFIFIRFYVGKKLTVIFDYVTVVEREKEGALTGEANFHVLSDAYKFRLNHNIFSISLSLLTQTGALSLQFSPPSIRNLDKPAKQHLIDRHHAMKIRFDGNVIHTT
jgi:hypothetical protein